jgi:hypothetical protein
MTAELAGMVPSDDLRTPIAGAALANGARRPAEMVVERKLRREVLDDMKTPRIWANRESYKPAENRI